MGNVFGPTQDAREIFNFIKICQIKTCRFPYFMSLAFTVFVNSFCILIVCGSFTPLESEKCNLGIMRLVFSSKLMRIPMNSMKHLRLYINIQRGTRDYWIDIKKTYKTKYGYSAGEPPKNSI